LRLVLGLAQRLVLELVVEERRRETSQYAEDGSKFYIC